MLIKSAAKRKVDSSLKCLSNPYSTGKWQAGTTKKHFWEGPRGAAAEGGRRMVRRWKTFLFPPACFFGCLTSNSNSPTKATTTTTTTTTATTATTRTEEFHRVTKQLMAVVPTKCFPSPIFAPSAVFPVFFINISRPGCFFMIKNYKRKLSSVIRNELVRKVTFGNRFNALHCGTFLQL